MKQIVISIAFFTLTATQAGHAQNNAVDSVRIYSISGVNVYADRDPGSDVIPAQTLAGDELQRLGEASIADAIRYFSGVQIKDYGGIGGLKTVDIRSMGTQHVGVFYDGVQLGNAQNGQIDLGRFSMDNMEAVSVYNGQRSDIFQSAKDFASAAAVYMTSRRPQFTEGKRHNLRLALKGGSFGTVNPSMMWERRLSENLDAQLSAEYMYTTGRYRFSYRRTGGYDTTEVRRNGDVKALRAEGSLFGRLKKGDWRTKIYLYDSERGYPGASVREEPGRFRHEDRQWDTNLFAQGSLRQYFGRYNLMLNAKYALDRLHYLSDPRLDAAAMPADNRYSQQEVYFSAANAFALTEWWKASLSADIQHNTLDADLVDFVYPCRLTVLAAGATALESGRFKAHASLLYTRVHDETRTGDGPAGDKNRWTPTVTALYKPFRRADLSIRAFYKRIFRMPTLNDLYYTFVGNKELDPEFTTQYNLEVVYGKEFARGLFRSLEVQLDGYFNKVEGKIIAVPGDNQFRWTMTNLGYVEIRGLDAAVRTGLRLGSVDVKTRLTYTYQRAQDFTDPSDPWYGGQISYIPYHSGSAVAGAAWRDWDINYSFIYTGERWESRANTLENYVLPWYTSDLSLSRTIRPRGSELRITAGVNNILDQKYDVVRCYPMPGMNFNIKVSWTL